MTEAFEARVETYVKTMSAEERQLGMKKTAAAIESIKVTTDAAFAAMNSKLVHQDKMPEQRLSDSLLLYRVDPINWPIEALHMGFVDDILHCLKRRLPEVYGWRQHDQVQ